MYSSKSLHSVTLDKDSCKGCTNCLKNCPTQAIRVQKGKAKILKERCIDCGECIRVCPYHAKKAVTDSYSILSDYRYTVALVAPAFYAQFSKADDINLILTALKATGFDDVFEVALGAEIVSAATRELLDSGELLKPTISSACPAVVKLIAVRFPNLINHVIPLRAPMEVAATIARRRAAEKTGLAPEEIGIIFISPCAAKATEIKFSQTVSHSEVNGVIAVKDAYLRMAQHISSIPEDKIEQLSVAGREGILWATVGGEASATSVKRHISVDGIHNVIKILEDIEDKKLEDIEFIEALSCTGGCVGGPLTAENSFVAESRLHRLCREIPHNSPDATSVNQDISTEWDRPIVYRPVMSLDPDLRKAMEKVMRLEKIFESLPGLDCGSCGSPCCHALAEDIVRGYAQETDCIFKLREKIGALAREMVALETCARSNDETEED